MLRRGPTRNRQVRQGSLDVKAMDGLQLAIDEVADDRVRVQLFESLERLNGGRTG
jgi:hypothetical protein